MTRIYATRDELLAAEVARGSGLLQDTDKLDDSPQRATEKDLTSKVLSEPSATATLSDPNARWRLERKTNSFLRSKAHTSCDEDGVATAVCGGPANGSEIERVESLVEEAKDVGVEPEFDSLEAHASTQEPHSLHFLVGGLQDRGFL